MKDLNLLISNYQLRLDNVLSIYNNHDTYLNDMEIVTLTYKIELLTEFIQVLKDLNDETISD